MKAIQHDSNILKGHYAGSLAPLKSTGCGF